MDPVHDPGRPLDAMCHDIVTRYHAPLHHALPRIRMMESEHMRIESALDQLREFARDVSDADASAPGWRECIDDLLRLDDDLRDHHRFENEVLFPAALDLERRIL